MPCFRLINKIVLIIFLNLIVAINASAQDIEYIKCPKLDKIHQATSLMTYTQCRDGYCDVYSGEKPAFYESNLGWGIVAFAISSSSTDDAILKAQTITNGVSVMDSKLAGRSIIGYLCLYFLTSSNNSENDISAVVAAGHDKRSMHSVIGSLINNRRN